MVAGDRQSENRKQQTASPAKCTVEQARLPTVTNLPTVSPNAATDEMEATATRCGEAATPSASEAAIGTSRTGRLSAMTLHR